MVLALALLAMVLLGTLTGAFLTLSATEPLIATNLLRGSQAFYVAESGLEIALWQANQASGPASLMGTLGEGTYAVTVAVEDATHVRVRSVGRVGPAIRIVSNTFERTDEGVWQPMRRFREEGGGG